MKNVLFYGDSNTWGFDPRTGNRYPYDKRWTSICAEELGDVHLCIPSGMNGRTTIYDDPMKGCRNGIEGLDFTLQTHKPIDIFVLMLGTNDLKYASAEESAAGMSQLVSKLKTVNQRFSLSSPVFPDDARILLVAPISLNQDINETGTYDAREESEKIPGLYAKIAEENQLDFMDASRITPPSETDGVHLSEEGHKKLGQAIAAKIKTLYGAD